MKRRIERISTSQLTLLSGGVMLGTTFLPISSVLARSAGSDSTIGLVASGLVAVPFAYFVAQPAIFAFPRKALVAQFRLAFGEVLGRGLALILGLAAVAFAAGLARQPADVYIISMMPRTPVWVFSFPVLLLCAVLCLEGIEVMTRYVSIVFPLVAGMLLLLVLFSWSQINMHFFLPVFEYGIAMPLRALMRGLTFGSELIVFVWTIVPTVNQPRGASRSMAIGAAAAGVVLVLVNFATIGVFSAPEVARMFYATIDLANILQSGPYIRGVESVVIGFFTAASVLKTSAFLLAGTRIIADVLNRPDYRPLVIPVAVVCAAGAVLIHSATQMVRVLDVIAFTVWLPSFLILPPVVWALGKWQQRRKRAKAKASAA